MLLQEGPLKYKMKLILFEKIFTGPENCRCCKTGRNNKSLEACLKNKVAIL